VVNFSFSVPLPGRQSLIVHTGWRFGRLDMVVDEKIPAPTGCQTLTVLSTHSLNIQPPYIAYVNSAFRGPFLERSPEPYVNSAFRGPFLERSPELVQ